MVDDVNLVSRPIAVQLARRAAAKVGARAYGEGAAASAVVLGELARLAARGQLEVPIARTYPLEHVRDAFRELEQQHTHGKIVLRGRGLARLNRNPLAPLQRITSEGEL
ncbi:zinc-binding dehydrogenase [Streptomyces sp. NPDC021969]|uniref:zinc-binding dehydrogenase n=1 Tax=unclassified Streptomyces TaxID=2593676 RepID=UPI0033FFE937